MQNELKPKQSINLNEQRNTGITSDTGSAFIKVLT